MAVAAGRSRQLVRELIISPLLSQRRRLGGIAAALLFLSVSNGLFLLVAGSFIKALFQAPGRATVPLIELLPKQAQAYGAAFSGVQLDMAMLAVGVPLVMLVAGVCRATATYLYQLHQQALVLYIFKVYRERLFAAVLALPYTGIRRRQTGEWMSIVMNDVLFIQMRFSDVLGGVILGGVSVGSSLVVLAFCHWPSALAIVTVAPFIAFGMGRTGKRIARYAEAFQREMGRIAGAVLDLRGRFDFIRAQQAEAREAGRFAALNLAYYQMIRRSIMIRSAFAPGLEFLGFVVFAAFVYAIGKNLWGNFSPELMLLVFGALGMLLKPLRDLGEQLSRYHETKGTLMNSLELFAQLETGRRPVSLAAAADGGTAKPAASPSATAAVLDLQRLRAGMAGETRFAATDLRLSPGRAVAVIGPSGAGKSTLLKTLAGLVEPLEWVGTPTWHDLAGTVSMVSQDPFLFDDTIAANLTYGLDAAAVPTAAAIWKALATVNIDQEIGALPDGLNTRLRAIGSNVSGGQLQRLVIARGLLRQKPIWLLDEATSAVDARSEKDITQRLIADCREAGRALLAVTHRLTWLDAFDEVWFVEDGRIVLAGPHRTLLAERRYREYCAAAGGAGDGHG